MKTIKIVLRKNEGQHKLGVKATCAHCGKSLKGAKTYFSRTLQTESMCVHSFEYFHWDCLSKEGVKPTGSGWGNFIRGKQVMKTSAVKVGDLLLEYSRQFDAYNICRVTKVNPDQVYAIFVDPVDTAKLRQGGDAEFCVWAFEMDERGTVELYQPDLKGTKLELWAMSKRDLENPDACHSYDDLATGSLPVEDEAGDGQPSELGVLVERNGTVTNRWTDGTKGVPDGTQEYADDEEELSHPVVGGEPEPTECWLDVLANKQGDFVAFVSPRGGEGGAPSEPN